MLIKLLLYVCSVHRSTVWRHSAGSPPQCAAQRRCLCHCMRAGSQFVICTDSTVSIISNTAVFALYLCYSHVISEKLRFVEQEAQLSQRDRTMLHVIEYFAKLLKIIRNGTIRKLRYGFLLGFHSNYGSVLYHFWDKVRYWQKIAIFSYPLCIRCPG